LNLEAMLQLIYYINFYSETKVIISKVFDIVRRHIVDGCTEFTLQELEQCWVKVEGFVKKDFGLASI
jgi:hypothetical protein